MIDTTDLFTEVPGTSEDEQDFGSILPSELSGVAIANTDWTTETLLNQLHKGNIQLNPRFQRRDAWELKRKSQFIESLILGLPVPQIVLAERPEQKGTYIVLDGKQRLLCLRQFTAQVDDTEYESFKLSGLVVREKLNGMSMDELRSDVHFQKDVTAFENSAIRAVVLRNWKTEKLLGHIFLRLNMGSKPLSPQELRQALHPGPFLNFTDEVSVNSTAIRSIFGGESPDFRMRDVELVIRYLSFKHRLSQYRGNLKEFLDSSCAYFNQHWNSLSQQLMRDISDLDANVMLIHRAFGAGYNFGKWVSERFERRFNRAVFDILVQALSHPDVADAIQLSPEKMVDCFRSLCSTDSQFLDSIERTTKSIEATRYRFTVWYQSLSEAYGMTLPQPRIGV